MRLHRVGIGRGDQQLARIRFGIPGLAHAQQHRPAADVMAARRRQPRHRAAFGLQADRRHPGQRGDLIGPGARGVDQLAGLIGPAARGDLPAAGSSGDGAHRRLGHGLAARRAQGFGKVLQHPVGVDILCRAADGGKADGVRVQDRHHGAGLVQLQRRHSQLIHVAGKAAGVPLGAQKHQPARRQVAAVTQVSGAGAVQGYGGAVAIVFFEQRGGAAGGMVAKRVLHLQEGDAAQVRKPRGGADAGHAAADDDEILHGSNPVLRAGPSRARAAG